MKIDQSQLCWYRFVFFKYTLLSDGYYKTLSLNKLKAASDKLRVNISNPQLNAKGSTIKVAGISLAFILF